MDTLGSFDRGQPPAGWVLVWAGRFKRWRRRWFLAHPAGLLLYYKNSEQLGRPGCISLQGAQVSPTAGKERQFKIRRGTIVYYLRTLKKENRQAWLETILRSIGTYERSWQKVGVGAKSVRSLVTEQSVPAHLSEEWKQQETEVSRRLGEKMQELEPVRQAFLRQVQGVQQSLSVLSDAFGFKSGLSTGVESSPAIGPKEQAILNGSPPLCPNANGRLSVLKLPGAHRTGIISAVSEPIPHMGVSEAFLDEEQTSNHKHFSMENCNTISENRQGSCINRELFGLKRREMNGTNSNEKGHSSDTEVCSSSNLKGPLRSGKAVNGRIKQEHAKLATSLSTDSLPVNRTDDSLNKSSSGSSKYDLDVSNVNNQSAYISSVQKEGPCNRSPLLPLSHFPGHAAEGQLHAAWNHMEGTFAEILREEIQRVIELEAENAVLQRSIAILPQLQQDHKDLLDLRERLQRDKPGSLNILEDMDGEFGDYEDTDDEVSLAPSDVTNEDYYEALEVLNQHEFISKSIAREDVELLGEGIEYSQEPLEEGDLCNDTESLSEVEGDDYENPRIRLPAPRPLQRGFSLWSVLKNAIGKDLNHITMPATINEPMSVLQRCAEELQFTHLLEKASQLDNSLERLVWITTFACATYHGSPHRDAKPFNPLLGETYEWQSQDGRLRFIAEQVSHHPPVLAFHCENHSCDYTLDGEIEIKNRFWGKSVEVFPCGRVHLHFPKYGDHFSWSKITTCIHNVVVGKLWIDNYGELVIRNHTTGEVSRIRFQKATSKEQGRIAGKVFDNKGIPVCSLSGNYMTDISVIPEACWIQKDIYGGEKCLWRAPARNEDYEQQYCFSRFTIGLNELTPELRDALPPTDSRFRPDQRALEDGDLEKATPEKIRLEEKQREGTKKRKEKGQEWNCMWFQQGVPGVYQVKTAPESKEPSWVFNHKYWKAREQQDWLGCPDIM